MIDWWLDQPDGTIFGVLIALYGLTGAACVVLSHLPALRPAVLPYHGVVAPFFVSAGTLFALMTAFLGGAVHEGVRNANQAVMQEREAALRIITLAEALPHGDADEQIPDLTRDYVRSVLSDEWPLPRDTLSAPSTEAALVRLFAVIADREVGARNGNAIQAAFLRAGEQISAARVTRLSLSRPVADNLRWVGVLVLGILAQVSVAVVHLERLRPQLLALLLATAAIVTSLAVVAATERPFTGLLRVSRAPLERLLAPPPQ